MANIFRKIGRAIDPTSSSAPLGGIVKGAITAVGGGAILGAVSSIPNPFKGQPAGSTPGGAPSGVVQPPPVRPIPAPVGTTYNPFPMSKAGVGFGLLAAIAAVVFLLLRKR